MNEKNLIDAFWGWVLGIGLVAGVLFLFRAAALWYWQITDVVQRLDRIAAAVERLSPPTGEDKATPAPTFKSRKEYEEWKASKQGV